MRKIAFSIGAFAIAFMVAFAWSQAALTPSQAAISASINPTDMMSTHKATLPVEQWEAI
ncbi:MAG: hypothetical protein J0H42_13430 [Rhizobiales bacterium]|nr:hypothetical protein [Hyphomicrobiales bacterium]